MYKSEAYSAGLVDFPPQWAYTKSTTNWEGTHMKTVNAVALLLIIVGGLNWGLVGAFEYNLVDGLFGEGSALARTVYVLVGLAAVYKLVIWVARLSSKNGAA